MNRNRWNAVDAYFAETIVVPDRALEEALAANAAEGLPSIDVSAPQGKLIHLLARMTGARKALEIGALGGYSTIWLARALPDDGKLVSLGLNERHAAVARENIARAGLAGKVEVRTGRALAILPKIEAEGLAPSDFVFIDADKTHNPEYLAWALRLSRPGTAILVDNVVRDGEIAVPSSTDADAIGTHVRGDGARASAKRDRDPDRRREGVGRIRARHCQVT